MRLACVLAALCGLVATGTWAAEPVSREELKRQREAIELEHDRRAEACRHQFVVTPCMDKVRAERQEALSSVRDQESALDAAQRQLKAKQRESRLADKVQADQKTRKSDAPIAAPIEPPAKAAPVQRPKEPRAPASSQDRRALEQQRRAEYEARQREIKAHREEVEKRNAERARRKAPQPLPPPASAAS